jgi:hypothetical protein
MNTEALLTTIDLAPLLDMRARFAEQLAGIAEQLNADDAQAAEVAERMLDDETAAIDTVVEQFRKLCGEGKNPESYVENFRQSLDGLRVTGDLYSDHDDYLSRRQVEAILGCLPVFVEALKAEPRVWRGGDGELQLMVVEQLVTEAIKASYLGQPVGAPVAS